MDPWLYFEVTHSTHQIMNPSSPARLEALVEVLELKAGHRVLDMGCGHAELLLRWHELAGTTGIGIDASPYQAERARERVSQRAPGAVEIIEGRGQDFATEEKFDVSCCLGVTWIWGGFAGTLEALVGFTRPGGAIVVGEPYWRREPPVEYLQRAEVERDAFNELAGCRRIALEQGLGFIWMAGSTEAEWDEYEMRQSASLDAYTRAHPDDPDLPELQSQRSQYEDLYFKWERDCLGWAIWVFRVQD